MSAVHAVDFDARLRTDVGLSMSIRCISNAGTNAFVRPICCTLRHACYLSPGLRRAGAGVASPLSPPVPLPLPLRGWTRSRIHRQRGGRKRGGRHRPLKRRCRLMLPLRLPPTNVCASHVGRVIECACVCVRACVHACVRASACMRACVRVHARGRESALAFYV